MSPIPKPVRDQMTAWIRISVRTFVATLGWWTLLGIVLAVIVYKLAGATGWWLAAGVLATLVEAIALGVFVAIKRTVALTTAYSLGSLQLGRRTVQTVFEHLFGMVEGGPQGERGTRLAQGLERLPLAEADELLRHAVDAMVGQPEEAGPLRRKLNFSLVALIHRFTLARFRQEAAQSGGVDLAKVQAELEPMIDAWLVRKLLVGVAWTTWLAVFALLVVVALQTWGLTAWAAAP